MKEKFRLFCNKENEKDAILVRDSTLDPDNGSSSPKNQMRGIFDIRIVDWLDVDEILLMNDCGEIAHSRSGVTIASITKLAEELIKMILLNLQSIEPLKYEDEIKGD